VQPLNPQIFLQACDTIERISARQRRKESVMNSQIQAIVGRRSIRKYTGEPVTDQEVQSLLEAAMSAPSAMATDPWRFLVHHDRW